MAPLFMHSTKVFLLFLTIFSSLQHFSVFSYELEVGDSRGWTVPLANDSNIYNEWASKNRFQIGDSLLFKYEKDSVMEVTGSDYKLCNSSHPTFFSNKGNTIFKLDRSGFFYFISGVSGHCNKGQKMIIRVLVPEDSRDDSSNGYIGSVPTAMISTLVILQFILPFMGLHLS